jgi:hypothetical protein
MTRRSIVVVGLLLAACGGAVGSNGSSSASSSDGSSSSGGSSGGECTAIGCVDGLSIALVAPGGWTPGSYVFTIVADGATQTCKGALPLPSCNTPGLRCDNTLATIGESGCALPSAEHSFADLRFASGPAKVKVHIERDGSTLADDALEPTYQTSQPNGPNCGPICRQASASISLVER